MDTSETSFASGWLPGLVGDTEARTPLRTLHWQHREDLTMASIDPYSGGRWRARYRTPEGKSRSRVFDRKLDARRWLASVEHQKMVGGYVDPSSGRITFRSYAEQWSARQVWRESTGSAVAVALARAYPVIGDRPIAALRTSELQALVRLLADRGKAPTTIKATYRAVAAVLKAAVTDRVLATSPAVGVRLPKIDRPRVQPLELEQVQALAAVMPARAAASVLFAAGSGLRMGEVLGLTVDRVDFLRRTVRVDRQMIAPLGSGVPTFGPPKTAASNRVVPLAAVTLEGLAAHLARWPAGPDGLIFTSSEGGAWRRGKFGALVRTAREKAGLPESVTFHDLRHHFASVLIGAGCSIKAVQEALGVLGQEVGDCR
jgi:integrase